MIKITAKLNAFKTENKNKNKQQLPLPHTHTHTQTEEINVTRSWFFEIINKIDKPPASWIKKNK